MLRGLRPEHWPRIRQVCLEVERSSVTTPRVRELLCAAGFEVHDIGDWNVGADADVSYVYAVRPQDPPPAATPRDEPADHLLTTGLLQGYLASALPPAMRPDQIVLVDRLPRLPNGKVARLELPPPPPRPTGPAAEPGGGALTDRLREAWRATLGVDAVHDEDTFVALGGHSLTALRRRCGYGRWPGWRCPRRAVCAPGRSPTGSTGSRRRDAMSARSADARHVVVVGAGRLARSLCHALAATPTPAPLRVTVLARDPDAAHALARAARVRATVAGTPVAVTARPFTAEPGAGPGEGYAADAASMARLRPDVLVCAASAQSPYERAAAPSAWTDLIAAAGFGVTLALQAELVSRLAVALAGGAPGATLVNGAFPDAVNPLLAARDLPVRCGIGNVATLAACLDAALGRPGQRRLAVLGHHAHLAAPGPDDEDTAEVRAWLDGRPVPDVTGLLAGYRALPRPELNALAGHAGAALVAALAAGRRGDGEPARATGTAGRLSGPAHRRPDRAAAAGRAAGGAGGRLEHRRRAPRRRRGRRRPRPLPGARPGGAGGVPAGPGRRLARERAARDRLPVRRPA